MIAVEAALARAQADIGLIPDGHALADALATATVDPAPLIEGTATAGVPVPALVAALRASVPDAEHLHWGATSQDIVDTAIVLCLKDALAGLTPRLSGLIDRFHRLSEDHAATVLAGRTWTQIATPTTFGLKAARWAQPLIALERTLPGLANDALRIQFGGAVGSTAVVAPHGAAISAAMATTLGLTDSPPWHSDRGALHALAAWFGRLTSALAKMAGDIILLSRSEIGEVTLASGGGSSTMPQKANPVRAETIRALDSLVHAALAGLTSTGAHLEDRDGAHWLAERVWLPQIVIHSAAALRHAAWLAATVTPNPTRMAEALAANPGTMAEAATFALAGNMPRTEAQVLVKRSLAEDVPLSTLTDAPVDWQAALDPAQVVPACTDTAARIFAARHG